MGNLKKKTVIFITMITAIIITVSIFTIGFAANKSEYKSFGPNEGTVTANNVNFRNNKHLFAVI